MHGKGKCPAKDKECNACHGTGRLFVKCRTKTCAVNKTETENEATVNGTEAKDGTVTENETVNEVITDTEPPWHTTLMICRTAVRFKIDSGATQQ